MRCDDRRAGSGGLVGLLQCELWLILVTVAEAAVVSHASRRPFADRGSAIG